jgi:hypothetical protein
MIEFIENIKNKIYFLCNKIIFYSFSKLNIFEKQNSISNNKIIKNTNNKKTINYNNNEEMYGQFIYFD